MDMKLIMKMWIQKAAIEFVNHPAPRYVLCFALITGVLFTVIPLMNFTTGFQVGLIMGAYNYLAEKRISK